MVQALELRQRIRKMPNAQASGPSKAATHAALNQITQSSNAKVASMPLFPGESLVMNPASPAVVPRGLIETDFVPHVGNQNLTKSAPPVPLPAMPSQTRMPAYLGADFQNSTAVELAGFAYMQWIDQWVTNIEAQFLKDMVAEDQALISATLVSTKTLTQVRVDNSLASKKCKDDDDKKRSPKRFRIHGYSRKGAGKVTNPRGPRGGASRGANLPSNQRVLSTRRFSQILRQTIHSLTVDCIASNASYPGNGVVATDQAVVGVNRNNRPTIAGGRHYDDSGAVSVQWPDPAVADWDNDTSPDDESKWRAYFPDSPPDIDITGKTPDLPLIISETNGRDRLIPLDRARDLARDLIDNWQARIENRLTSQRGYRAWNYRQLVKDRVVTAYNNISEQLEAACYATSKDKARRGPQLVSTRRNVAAIPPLQYFIFSGHPAIRFPRGKPPLPEAEWLRRYRARLKKRNKTGRTRKDKKGRTIHVPKTKYGRPRTILTPSQTPK